jgi:hypothetical protein
LVAGCETAPPPCIVYWLKSCCNFSRSAIFLVMSSAGMVELSLANAIHMSLLEAFLHDRIGREIHKALTICGVVDELGLSGHDTTP